MNTMRSWIGCRTLFVGWLVLAGLPGVVLAATPTDFGYRHTAARPTWPTLVILVDFDDTSIPHDRDYWHDYVFDPNHQPESVNGWFNEVSLGRFALVPGGTVLITQSETNRFANVLARVGAELADQIYLSNIVHHAMISGQYNFSQNDVITRDGWVTSDELLVLILAVGEGGAVRNAGDVKPPGFTVGWRGGVSSAKMDEGLAIKCHELSHLLGTVDIYGVWLESDLNPWLSIMSVGLCHPDIWHKLRLGWCEPRIRSLTAGGVESLTAPQLGTADAGLILFDDARGLDEYFLLEYRTFDTSVGEGYDKQLPGSGLLIWQVRHDGSHQLVHHAEVAYPGAERDWSECKNCNTFVHNSFASSPCASTNAPGGLHSLFTVDTHWALRDDPGSPDEHGWARCSKCGSLFYGPAIGTSRCPAGGRHDSSGSGDYSLRKNPTDPVGHNHWRRCLDCQSLFLLWTASLFPSTSACPAGGRHNPDRDEYATIAAWSDLAMLARGAPDLGPGVNTLWSSGAVTPYLRWFDGTETRVRVIVHPFAAGADSITVEWLGEYDTWVDFNFTGTPENGTFWNPFDTLAEGVTAVSRGGTLNIKTGASPETSHITKPMRIHAYGGPVTIGR